MKKSILDPSSKYRPSHDTDIRKTFERVRAEMKLGSRVIPLKAVAKPSQSASNLEVTPVTAAR
jgi:hypothetical protein